MIFVHIGLVSLRAGMHLWVETMRKIFMLAASVALSAGMRAAVVEVADIAAAQRYPWNGKVDIEFTLSGEHEGAQYRVWVYCYDEVGKRSIATPSLRYEGEGVAAGEFFLHAGRHRLVWDAGADAPNGVWENLTINVDAELHSEDLKEKYTAQYLVIDLSGGAEAQSYPVTALSGVPEGGWTEEYKTSRLVLAKCPKGRDPTDASAYEITQEFYAGIFEVTQKQWELVMGTRPSEYDGVDAKPVESVGWEDIRGKNKGAAWPQNASVDAESFMGRLRSRTGLGTLDLPTKSMGEYASRAGTKTRYYTGDAQSDLSRAGWYEGNNWGNLLVPNGVAWRDTHEVGLKEPNGWGLYDTLGNVAEWRLDWFGLGYAWSGNDPPGPESGQYRCYGGGSWWSMADGCTADSVAGNEPWATNPAIGFRVFRTVPPIRAQGSQRGVRLDTTPSERTATTPIAIPHKLLDEYLPAYGGDAGDYEAAANAVGPNGMNIWQSIALGLDPMDASSRFVAKIDVGGDGRASVMWEPDLRQEHVQRVYRVLGAASPGGPWQETNGETMPQFRFFKVALCAIED